ncbi:hypothetical protein RYZ26_15290 [Terasakiella sp. A23]|uniref:hypothetical protein n=1 Tax=Terasakiella sp. FCG-A23 TaxID=3080561 RepID=UPI002954CA0E|nr:hypothetical protein [Terasakiella sp. A23]MDV7340969.1 hypothetical protein [Terasakiella sp. A23]
MGDFDTQVQLDLFGNVVGQSKRFGRAIKDFTSQGARSFASLKRASIGLSNGIDNLGNRYTGLVTAAATTWAARGVMTFEDQLKDIEVQAGLTKDQVNVLRKTIFDTSQDSNIRIDPAQLMAGVDAIIEKTGDLKLAQGNIQNMGLAIRAVRAEGRHIGAVIAGLKKLNVTEPDEVRKALELLIEQGKDGAFTFQNLAAESGPLMASLAAMGQKGMGAVRVLGAMAQTTQMATDSAAESSTAIQALINEIAAKGKSLEKKGITVFDPRAAAEGREVFLSLDTIIQSIMERSEGRMTRWGTLFGDEAKKALKTLGADYQDNGQLDLLKQFMDVQVTGTKIVEDAASKTQTLSGSIDTLTAAGTRLANSKMAGPIQSLSDAINDLDADQLNILFNAAATGVTAAAGIWAVNKAVRTTAAGVRMLSSLRGKSTSIGSASKALNAAAAQPVLVTNWPAGFGGSMTSEGARNSKRKLNSRGGRFASLGRLAGRAGRIIPGATVALGAYQLGSAALDGDTKGLVSSGGMIAGGLAGAKLGAMAGMLAGPIGAAVGSAVGGIAGSYFGGEAIESLYSSFFGDKGDKSTTDNAELKSAMSDHTKALNENTRALAQKSSRRFAVSHSEYGGLEGGAP